MGMPSAPAGMGSWLTDWAINAVTGTLSDAQKAALIEQEAQALVTASIVGTLSIQEARAIATQDVTAALLASNADPSQAGFTNIALFDEQMFPNLTGWLLGGLGFLALIMVVKD